MKKEELIKYFDHTNLKRMAIEDDIRKLCREAAQYNFAAVCVNSCYVKLAKESLKDTEIKVCSVIEFPLGAASTQAKEDETKQAIKDGSDEIDMVINGGALRDKNYDFVENDIQAVVKAANGKIVKVIIECCDLTDEEKIKACEIAKKAGAHFV